MFSESSRFLNRKTDPEAEIVAMISSFLHPPCLVIWLFLDYSFDWLFSKNSESTVGANRPSRPGPVLTALEIFFYCFGKFEGNVGTATCPDVPRVLLRLPSQCPDSFKFFTLKFLQNDFEWAATSGDTSTNRMQARRGGYLLISISFFDRCLSLYRPRQTAQTRRAGLGAVSVSDLLSVIKLSDLLSVIQLSVLRAVVLRHVRTAPKKEKKRKCVVYMKSRSCFPSHLSLEGGEGGERERDFT
jgi:hypothetical protein